MNNIRIFVSMAILLIFLTGCGRGEKARDKTIIARIDNYEMTADDFKSEVDITMGNKPLPADPAKAREELLDELITKKVLLAEAQKQNFDKDRAFMKEIERYWEQALLKILYKKKSAELLENVRADDREPEDVRNVKLRDAIDAWIDGLRSRARIKIYRENLEKVELE